MEDVIYNNVVGAIITLLIAWGLSEKLSLREKSNALGSEVRHSQWLREEVERIREECEFNESNFHKLAENIEEMRPELERSREILKQIAALVAEVGK